MLIYAHRGASAVEPENTLRAFARALEMGADGIEFDVRATADGVPVVIHDRNLARTTDGYANVDAMTLDQLRRLDAGKGERVPTLDEALALVGDRVRLDIEIKQAGIEREIIAVLARHPGAVWAISSFDWSILRRLRSLSTTAQLWPLTSFVSDAVFAAAHDLGATAIVLHAPALTSAAATRSRERGLEIVVWTVNVVEDALTACGLGAAGLCTDAPDVIRAAIAETRECRRAGSGQV